MNHLHCLKSCRQVVPALWCHRAISLAATYVSELRATGRKHPSMALCQETLAGLLSQTLFHRAGAAFVGIFHQRLCSVCRSRTSPLIYPVPTHDPLPATQMWLASPLQGSKLKAADFYLKMGR